MGINRISLGTTSARILPIDRYRTAIAIMNNHATAIIYIRFDRSVSSGNGFPIRPYGVMSLNRPWDDTSKEVWAISDTASTGIVVYDGACMNEP